MISIEGQSLMNSLGILLLARWAVVRRAGLLLGCLLGLQVACSSDGMQQQPVSAAGTTAMAGTSAAPPAGGSTAAAGTSAAAPVASAGTGAAQPGQAGRSGAAGQSGASATASAGTAAPSGGAEAAAGSGGGSAPAPAAGGGGAAAAGSSGSTGGAGPAVCSGSSTLMPGDSTKQISFGGQMRQYLLHVPRSYDGKTPVPLVIDLHPILSDAMYQKGASGYQQLSDSEGFIAAWPDGLDNAWNVGPCCTRSRDVDDVGFVRAVVEEIEKASCVDVKRVYADGYSMGGGMTHYVACHAADIFAAVAPSAFDLLEENVPDCKPARPISQMLFRGTSDPIVPYTGGASNPPNGLNVTIHFLGAVNTFKKWGELNGCTDMPLMGTGGCQSMTQCKDGTEVVLCTKQGGGHDTGDAKQGWSFMKRFTLP
jgi:poly(3-hydroxybutyrate) depolymerase